MTTAKKYLLSLLPALVLTLPVRAQSVGASISGVIKDASGAALPAAAVTIKNVETGAERKLVSDSAGRFAAPSISVGLYQVRAEKEGFDPKTRNGLYLVTGQRLELELTLSVGELRQSITVAEAPSMVVLSTQQTSGLVSERQVKDLPLNGRSYDQLLTLNPATVNYTSEKSGGVGSSNSAVGNMFAVSGRRPQENLFLLNGIEYTGNSTLNLTPGGASGELLGVDAVREFNVVTDTYGAEYGKRPGAQVSITTASGTNQVHGAAYEFLRNSVLDARNFFDHGPIPQFQRNVFGGALGGPLRKDKAFLFGNYEGFRQNLGLSNVTLVPSNEARAGYLPGPSGELTRVAVAPSAAALLSLWPVQNGPDLGGGIGVAFSHPLQRIREDFGTARFDYNFAKNDSLFVVYTIDDSADHTPSANPLSSVIESLRNQVLSFQEQHVFSPVLLNTARVGLSRSSFFFTGVTAGTQQGWVAGRPIGAIIIGGGTALNGASQITPAGTNAGSNLDTVRNLLTYEDNLSLTHGRHQISAGAWMQQIRANDNLAQYQYGQASFGSLAAFLAGSVSTFTVVPSPTPLGWRSLEAAGFVQDAIKVRTNLELQLGFRFESTNGWNEAHGRASNYVFGANGVIETNPRIGRSALTVNRAKFLPDPRVALAWDPFGKGKTMIRSGFGIYRALLDNIDYRLDQNAPFNTTQSYKDVPLASVLIAPGAAIAKGGRVSPSGVQPDAHTPTVISWTFKVEQEVTTNTSLALGYIGSHGYHEMLSADANEPFPTIVAGAVHYAANAPLANPAVANTTTWFSEGLSSYNALELDLNRRLSRGLQVRGVYTFSKSLDDGTAWNSSVGANAPGFVMFPLNPKLDWGPATSDVRNLFALNGTYELPPLLRKAQGWRKKLAGGWLLSGIGTFQSGFPFTPQLGFNPTNNGDSRNPIRPSWNPAFSGKLVPGRPDRYFNPNAFVVPLAGTYGNAGRNVLTGPGMANVDASLLKSTVLTERVNAQLRIEVFNVLNHANFGTPNSVVFTSASTVPAPTAGVITSTSTPSRQVQIGLKLAW